VVVEVNADVQEFFRTVGASALRAGLARALERASTRGGDAVVALTPGLKRMVVERHGVAAERVTVIPSGTDPDHFAAGDAAAARAGLGLDPARAVVGFVGLFYLHQGVDTLLRALARLPEPAGLLVGDGVMRPRWEALARELGLAGRVRFAGQVPYAEVPRWLAAMDVVAAPFTPHRGETSPFKVLDALAAGRPVVASDLPSVRPLAEASGGVVLVPPGDPEALAGALRDLLADPGRRATLGRRGREFVVARHAWDKIGRELQATLKAIGPRR
jgi:glycosyltransferase involved in cell wall biosynthesis